MVPGAVNDLLPVTQRNSSKLEVVPNRESRGLGLRLVVVDSLGDLMRREFTCLNLGMLLGWGFAGDLGLGFAGDLGEAGGLGVRGALGALAASVPNLNPELMNRMARS